MHAPPRGGRLGSIPAHTGKPRTRNPRTWGAGVYPRPHGEAEFDGADLSESLGLSPPTRGSPMHQIGSVGIPGSIPAHTGKPALLDLDDEIARVYPRPHGEAVRDDACGTLVFGLSPPTRGSREERDRLVQCERSIPAHTGKPRPSRWQMSPGAVYPRPHGEASTGRAAIRRPRGLSPPTRGSPGREDGAVERQGSIPAHTGKPGTSSCRAAASRVYPRPHGEARPRCLHALAARGLSPPTRGSLSKPFFHEPRSGSIPAHTGKPLYSAVTFL